MKTRIILLFIIGSLFFSCDAMFKTVNGEGPVVSQEILLEDFYEIEVSSSWEVELIPAPEPAMIIHTEENLIPMVGYQIRNGKLYISHQGSIGKSKSKLIQVFYRQLHKIEATGSSKVFSPAILEQPTLELETSSSGRIDLKTWTDQCTLKSQTNGIINIAGITKELNISAQTSSEIHAKELKAENANVYVSDKAKVWVYVTESLHGEIKKNGKIEHFGNPKTVKIIDNSKNGRTRSSDRVREEKKNQNIRETKPKDKPVRGSR